MGFNVNKLIICLIISGLIVLSIGLLVFGWMDLEFSLSLKADAEKIAQFGDFIGGVAGSFWALAGVLLFYKALTEQREDFQNNKQSLDMQANALDLQVDALNQQIEEFKLNRRELIDSRKVYEEQSKTIKLQQFESSFYSLLNLHQSTKEKLDFVGFVESLDFCSKLEGDVIQRHNRVVAEYDQLYLNNRQALSHYFRVMYQLAKSVRNNRDLSEYKKAFYMDVLRAQFSDYEIIILYYNSHSIYGIKNRSLILEYNLLKHYPLFFSPEFKLFMDLEGAGIIKLEREITSFLSRNLGLYYDVTNDSVYKVEEKLEGYPVILGIYLGDDGINISLYVNGSLLKAGFSMSNDQFNDFLYQLLLERMVFSQYLEFDQVDIKRKVILSDGEIEFSYLISSDLEMKISVDKY